MANLRDKLRDRQPPRKRSVGGKAKQSSATAPALDFNPRLLLMAAVIAGVAALLAVLYLVNISAGIAGRGQKEAVWVCRQGLPARHEITASDVTVREVPLNFLAQGFVARSDSPVGKITLAPLAKGEVLLTIRVADPGAQTGLTPKLHPDQRAFVVIPQGAQDIPLVKPDDRVDLIATLPESGGSRQMISTQVLQSVRVLAIGDRMSNDASASGNPQTDGGAVTLAVPAGKITLLTILKQDGYLHISARAPGDTSVVTPAIPENQLASVVMGQIPRPKPHVAPPPRRPHVIIHYVPRVIRIAAPRPRPRPVQPQVQIYNGAHRQN